MMPVAGLIVELKEVEAIWTKKYNLQRASKEFTLDDGFKRSELSRNISIIRDAIHALKTQE